MLLPGSSGVVYLPDTSIPSLFCARTPAVAPTQTKTQVTIKKRGQYEA